MRLPSELNVAGSDTEQGILRHTLHSTIDAWTRHTSRLCVGMLTSRLVHADRLCLLSVAEGLLARILLSSRGKGLALLTVSAGLWPVIGFCTRTAVEREGGLLAWTESAVGGGLVVVGLCVLLPGARLSHKRAALVYSALGVLCAVSVLSLTAVAF